MYTIGQLAKRFQLSRSTLLYYDAIGLLPASSRSAGGYRLYCQQAVQRMQQIQLYRQAGNGVTVNVIRAIAEKMRGAT